MNKKRNKSQVEAEKRYGEKRKNKPRLPGGYLSEEENDLLLRVSTNFSSKKEAIFEGLKLLEKNLKK